MCSSDLLRRIRRREDLSQEQLAKRSSLHRTEIGFLERAERVCRIDTLMKLAGAMAVPPEELLDGIAWVSGPEPYGTFIFGTTTIPSWPRQTTKEEAGSTEEQADR